MAASHQRPARPRAWSTRELAAYLRKVHGHAIRIGREQLDHQAARSEHRVLAQGRQPRLPGRTGEHPHPGSTFPARASSIACPPLPS